MTLQPPKKGWRYQPVWVHDGIERVFGLCTVWIDASDRLDSWTGNPFIVPQGANFEELTNDIVRMLTDAYCWTPVAFAELKPGMTFERAVSQSQREGLARMIDATAHNFKAASTDTAGTGG